MKSKLTFTIIFLLILAQSIQSFGQVIISGNVSSIHDNLLVQYVNVKLTGQNTYSAETDSLGNYFLNVEAGNYNVMFCYLGWDTITVDKVIQSPIVLDTLITRTPYPVSYITAELLPDGKNCLVDWGQPSGPYELIYDDGTVDYYEIWEQAGGGYAIHVTPEVTPYKILGGRVFVGDGSYPPGGNFIGSQIKVGIIDVDGAYGLPGTLIDTATIVVDNFGWVDFYGVFDTYFENESFYLAIWQLGEQDESAPIGVDMSTNSGGLSYVSSPTSQSWNNFSHNLMIRAYVDGFDPGSYSTHRETGGFINYVFARVTNFDPCTGPASGTITPLALPAYIPVTINLSGQPPGTIAWAVKVVYDANESDWSYSNMVSRGSNTVEFNISLCNGVLPESAIITIDNQDTCIQSSYSVTTDENGYAKQEYVADGLYKLEVLGFNQVSYINDSLYIDGDTIINIEFIPEMNSPKDIAFDTVANIVYWSQPDIIPLLDESFNDTIFPPPGWSDFTLCNVGWKQHISDSSYPFYIPEGDSAYALSDNVHLSLPGYCDNTFDYLYLPVVELKETNTYYLEFDYYFDMGPDDDNVFIEFATYPGSNWNIINSLQPVSDWTSVSIDISPYASYGSGLAQFAFHHDGYNMTIPFGIAIDNVRIIADKPDILGYVLYLDDIVFDTVPGNVEEYQFENLIGGNNYDVCITSLYECGESDPTCGSYTYYEPPVFDLPYFQGWDSKSYTLDQWICSSDDQNWKISNSEGLPLPSLQFSGVPEISGEYSVNISSPLIDASEVDIGKIFFEFDIKSALTQNQTSDSLHIAIVSSEGHSTILKTSPFSDSLFHHYKFDVTSLVSKLSIHIELTCLGNGFSDQNGWFIDNIHIYNECNPPKVLTGREIWKEENSAVSLTWQAPDNHFSIKEWINWDDGFNHSALAADNGFNVAARWTPDQIKEFVGASLSKVKLFIADDVTQLVLKVWTGENASNLIYSEDVTNEISIGGWSELALSDSVILDVSNELWVGYSVSYSYGKFPAGVDKGPAVEGFGNMLSFDGVTWETTNQYGQNYNWNIQVYLEGTGKTQDNLTNLAGFNIYRKETDSDYTYYDFVEYSKDDSMFVYVDDYPSVALDFGYYYKVTSLWNSNIGQCESTPAKSQQNPDEDYVYVFLNDIVDNSSDNTIKVYPNPVYDMVSVFSSDEITSIRIINLSGKVEKNIWVNNDSSINIPLDNLRAGVYIMDIKTTKATAYEKLLIIR